MWEKFKDFIHWMRNQYMLWLMMIFVMFYLTFGLTLYWVLRTHLLQDIATLSDQPWLAHTQTIFGSVYMVANTFFLVATCILLWFLTQELDPVEKKNKTSINQILHKRWGGFYHPKAWMDNICQILPWMLVFCYTPGIFALCGADMNVIPILFYIFVGPTTLLMLTLTIHTCVFRNKMRAAIRRRPDQPAGVSRQGSDVKRHTFSTLNPNQSLGSAHLIPDEKTGFVARNTPNEATTRRSSSCSFIREELGHSGDPAHRGLQTPTAPPQNDFKDDFEDEKLLPFSQTNPLQ